MKLYQVDAFTNKLFSGNPAAVCPLSEWLPDDTMQKIAAENNLAETAFFVMNGSDYHLRWFTPTIEVKLCGHATLATAHVLFHHLGYRHPEISFQTKSGQLIVRKSGDRYTLDFPADQLKPTTCPPAIIKGLGYTPLECYRGRDDFMVTIENQTALENLQPDFQQISQLDARGLIVTAQGDEVDFVSRCFYTPSGIDEDSVTGSAHTSLIPYWSKQLGKTEMIARQLSARGGELHCKDLGMRVELTGHAITYLEGRMMLNDEVA